MTTDEFKAYFKSSYRFAKETGISHTQWIRWLRNGYIPITSQIRLELITHGKLKARLEDLGDEGL